MRKFWCFAHGREGSWEAICLDLDIAVHGRSLDDVRARLNEAIGEYVEIAMAEDPVNRDALLNRKVPRLVRANYRARYYLGYLLGRKRAKPDGDHTAGFSLTCPA